MSDATALSVTGRYWRWYPAEAPLGHEEEALQLDLDDTVFLLVDVYGARFDDDAGQAADTPSFYRRTGADPVKDIVRERIVPAKAAAKRAGLQVVYLTNYLSPGLSEGNEWRNMSIRTCGVDVLEAWIPPTPILERSRSLTPRRTGTPSAAPCRTKRTWRFQTSGTAPGRFGARRVLPTAPRSRSGPGGPGRGASPAGNAH